CDQLRRAYDQQIRVVGEAAKPRATIHAPMHDENERRFTAGDDGHLCAKSEISGFHSPRDSTLLTWQRVGRDECPLRRHQTAACRKLDGPEWVDSALRFP